MRYFTAIAAVLVLSALSVQSQLAVPSGDALPEVADAILNQPAVSPDGETLAFVHDGDIWTVPSAGGTARRLTITVDNDGDPQFSPDGRHIAFRSRRYGHDDVFVMPAEGGKAQRLTFADSADQPDCWLPDGSGIIFSSYRREGGRDLWVVRLEGGEPWPITDGGFGVNEYDAAISPNGKMIAYCTSGGDPSRRRGYHGHADGDIWLCDFDGLATSNHRRITENSSHDASPVWRSDDVVLFASAAAEDRGSERVAHIATYQLRSKTTVRVGNQETVDPKQLSIGGGIMAISSGNYGGWKLYLWNMMSAHPFRLTTPDIKLASDVRRADLVNATLTTADQLAPSPDGKKLAFIAGGDVFVMPADETGVPYQLTNTPGPEVSITWAPDSAHLAWVGQLRGTLHVADLRELGEAGAKIRDLPMINRTSRFDRPVFDPNGNLWAIGDEQRIEYFIRDEAWGARGEAQAYVAIPGNFHAAALGGGQVFQFSPDGKWIAFEQSNALYDDVVMLAEVATGKVHPISHLFGSATQPSFSADGKRVVFVNDQEDSYDVYTVDLAPQGPEFREDKLEKLFKKEGSAEPGAEAPGNGKEEPPKEEGAPAEKPKKPERKKPETKVVLDGIKDRIKRITTLDGHEFSPIALADGKTYLFIGNSQGQSNVWKLVIDPDKGPDLKQLTQSRSTKSNLLISADEKNLWWLDAGAITSMQLSGSKITTYAFRVEQRRDRAQLRATAFDQAAWVMGGYYYDRKHHGINWDDTARRYKQALKAVSTGDEYDALMDEMLGELNSSHQGYTGADTRSDDFTESTGCLGLFFDPLELAAGRYKIIEVVKGGPCELPEGSPAVGEYLVAINGAPLARGSNMADLLVSTIGRKTLLSLNGQPTGEGARRVAVKPIGRNEESRLFYARWVRIQRELVERLSKGRLGYVHIAAMNDSSLREFKHELGDEMLGKEGVVIDVRYNGGGSTAVDILEILYKKTWLKRQWGGLDEVSENIYRSIALEKPSTLLINQSSFSNAEIMAEGFRKLEIGKIVGVDTAGGVIGTGSFRLIDGSRMRLPSTGAFTVEGENLELFGRKPDIFVENQPEELDNGNDRQTETAVKTLLKQIDGK